MLLVDNDDDDDDDKSGLEDGRAPGGEGSSPKG